MNPEQNQETRGKWSFELMRGSPQGDEYCCGIFEGMERRAYVYAATETEARKLAARFIENLNSQSQWIRVEDRLPDKPLEYYLVFCPDKRKDKIRRAFLSVENEFIRNGELLKVTHWRELPTPPKD